MVTVRDSNSTDSDRLGNLSKDLYLKIIKYLAISISPHLVSPLLGQASTFNNWSPFRLDIDRSASSNSTSHLTISKAQTGQICQVGKE